MATTSITITKEAHNYLKSIKGNKSFSETIISLKRNPRALLDLVGTFGRLEDHSEQIREEMNNALADRHRRLFPD